MRDGGFVDEHVEVDDDDDPQEHCGVWVTDNPSALAIGGYPASKLEVVLTVDGLTEPEGAAFEVSDELNSYRLWFVPAEMLNRCVVSTELDEQL